MVSDLCAGGAMERNSHTQENATYRRRIKRRDGTVGVGMSNGVAAGDTRHLGRRLSPVLLKYAARNQAGPVPITVAQALESPNRTDPGLNFLAQIALITTIPYGQTNFLTITPHGGKESWPKPPFPRNP